MAEEPQVDTDEQPKRRPRTKVALLARSERSALVEWEERGRRRRGYVPAEELDGDAVAKDALAAAMPYGVAWGELVDFSGLTPEAFEATLNEAGVWTVKDLERQPGCVPAALAKLTTTAGQLHNRARQQEA